MNLKLLALILLIANAAEGKLSPKAVAAAAKLLSKIIKELVSFGVDNLEQILNLAEYAAEKAEKNALGNEEKANLIAELKNGKITLERRLKAMGNNKGIGAVSQRTKLKQAIAAAASTIKELEMWKRATAEESRRNEE